MVATMQFSEVDMTGELTDTDPTNILQFPGSWEPDPQPSGPAACALCEQEAELDAGLCSICSRRLPRTGGCGSALRLVAGLTAGDTGAALGHLTNCRQCRELFDQLGDLARVATFEADPAVVLMAA